MDWQYLISVCVGLLAGILSGLFGIGGGIVMVPMLVAVFGWPLLQANAASLAAMLLPVGIFGVWVYWKAGMVSLRNSLWIACGLFVGSFGGAELAMNVNVHLLSKLYAAFLFYVAMEYLGVPNLLLRQKKKEENREKELQPFWHLLLLGVGAGIIAGLFGKGGGVVIVPVLVKLFRYDPKVAAATSLCRIATSGWTSKCFGLLRGRISTNCPCCPNGCWYSDRSFVRFENGSWFAFEIFQDVVCRLSHSCGCIHGAT